MGCLEELPKHETESNGIVKDFIGKVLDGSVLKIQSLKEDNLINV